MTLPELLEKALTLPAACAESPFGPESICVRLGERGRIFASFMPMPGWVSFKCEPNLGMMWREQYPGTVRRGWHCPPVQQPYNNTLTMDGTVPDEVLLQMLFHSYDQAVDSLSRSDREALLGDMKPYRPEDEALVQSWIADEKTYWRWSAGSVGSWPLAAGMLNERLEKFTGNQLLLWHWQGEPAGFVNLFPQKRAEDKKQAFFDNAGLLSAAFAINPLMYGSLGLEYLTDGNLNADDVDILLPKTFLTDRWDELRELLEANGYVLVDEHEHTFEKKNVHYSYASIEELEPFAGISLSEINTYQINGVSFRLLSLKQYLKVYTASSKDGYRVETRNKKDSEKIAFINEQLSKEPRGEFCPKPITGNGVRLGYVALNPALRGQGLGKRMLACAVQYARRKMKAESLHLSVYHNNPAAIGCYEANGFVFDEAVPVRMDTCMGETWPCQAMKR